MSMFIQYSPYKLAPGAALEARRRSFADRCFDILNEYAPNFQRSVIDAAGAVAGRTWSSASA